MSAGELAEDHLLSGLGGNGLQKQCSTGTGIEVRQEAINAGLSPTIK